MIKRIELVNFMSHRHTVIEPAAGLTVLVGPNNCGKSAIVTALQILCHNDNSTYVLRHGAKECRIIVETDDGHRIEWIRKKSGSPSYKINCKDFDRLNKKESDVWDELKKTLRLPRVEFDNNKFDVHIGEQRNPVFLLGDKGKGAAQFFASSSDAIRLVEMQDLHKRQTAENKRERKRLATQQTQVTEAIECLESVPEVDAAIGKIEEQYAVLKTEEAKTARLDQALADLTLRQKETKRFAAINSALQALPQPPQFSNPASLQKLIEQIGIERASVKKSQALQSALQSLTKPPTFGNPASLQKLIEQLRSEQNSIRKSSSLKATFNSLTKPPAFSDSESLRTKLRSIRKLRRTVAKLSAEQQLLSKVQEPPESKDSETVSALAKCIVDLRTEIESCNEVRAKLKQAQQQLGQAKAEIEQWVYENPGCPTCGSEISADVILSGGHQHG
ncbi:AAA family ATPase [Mariniblastus fucicola]|uniref:Chromosome segregation protein n=1 Tax=Mariniblastus fucicola TaxID=980251 RepID=A0A5B9P816_9BACT|nr:AAA family ATPase [Mariniblastus fucicola]QEG20756.1 chromosome segregation protein [Mariniblastus fucicola]